MTDLSSGTFGQRIQRWLDDSKWKADGLRFYPDGTVEGGKSRPRSVVLAATYSSGLLRKNVVSGNNARHITVKVITADWAHTFRSKQARSKLYALAIQAKARANQRAEAAQRTDAQLVA